MSISPAVQQENINVLFAVTDSTFDTQPVTVTKTIPNFFRYLRRTSRRLDVKPYWTKAEYDGAKIGQAGIAPVGGRRKDALLQMGYVPFDFDKLNDVDYARLSRAFKRAPFLNIQHTTASHKHACKGYTNAFRVIVPLDTTINANDSWRIQRVLLDWMGLELGDELRDKCTEDANRMVYLPHKQAEFIESRSQRVATVSELLADAETMGLERKAQRALKVATSAAEEAIAAIAFENGWEPLSSGRGYEVECPNHHLHTGAGSTSIMLDGKEPRFVCQHKNNGACTALNSMQHVALRLLGVPDDSNVERRGVSRDAIETALPDMDASEREELRQNSMPEQNCANDDDLANEPEAPKREIKSLPVVPGWLHTDSTWMYTARTGSFKTFQILNMMAASAAGHPFGGLDTVEAHHFLIDAEGGSRTNDRIEALERQYGKKLDKLHVIPYGEKGIDVVSPEGVKRIIDAINEICGAEPCGIVAFDTLNRTFARKTGFKSASDGEDGMGGVVTTLKHIQKYTGGAVGVIAHPTKSAADNTAAGNMALQNGVDYALYSERNGKTFEINLWHEKAKHVEEISAPGRRFVATKIELRDNEHKPTREQISLFAPVPGLEVSGVEVSDKISTLFIAPISYEPFKSEAAEEGRKAVKKTRVLSPGQQWVYNLIEENDPLTASEIKGAHGKDASAPKTPYGGVQTWINQLGTAGYIHEKVDERGVKDNTYHIDTRMRPPVPVDEDELSDD